MTVELKDVAIRYIIGDLRALGLKDYVIQKLRGQYKVAEFWAVDGVSFQLEKGDFLGILGVNGAGKSTLLKAVSGIMRPTRGEMHVNGNIAALLELGSGFDADLTVKENIYLRGALLGYTRTFIDETCDDIISFAELGEFADRPFRQLSSGMQSRLAFSISCLVKPEILILDEVMAVGDGAFRKKSEAKMKEILNSGATTLYVSHAIEQMKTLCNKALWLHKGKQMAFGQAKEVIVEYERFLMSNQG
jgi:ABC-2 type transport system ATP-binding protein